MFDYEGNVANYRGAKLTTAARSISACGKQASSGTSVRTPSRQLGNGARDEAWEAKVPGPSATPHPQVTQRLSLAAGKITEP